MALELTEAFNEKANCNRCSILFILSKATLKSPNLLACKTETSPALPSMIAPLGDSASFLTSSCTVW